MDADDTDARIIERSVHAPELFGAIFDRHVIEVHRYLNRRAGPDSADSLVGDVFRIAFENRSRYLPDRECALPWLYGIAANVGANALTRLDKKAMNLFVELCGGERT